MMKESNFEKQQKNALCSGCTENEEVPRYIEMTNEEYLVGSPDYGDLIIEMVHKFHNKKLLSRIYYLAEYLYLYEDGE